MPVLLSLSKSRLAKMHRAATRVDALRVDARGDTALNLAAEFGHVPVVERLLAAGADLENLGGADKTPLMNAAFAGQVPVVQLLLEHGARINHDLLSSLNLK